MRGVCFSVMWPFYVYGFLSSAMLDQFVWMAYLMNRGYSTSDLGLAMLSFGAAYIACSVPSSYLSDRAGRRQFLVLGPVFKIASAFLFIDARSLGVVLAGTACAGVAFSVIADTDHACLHDVLVFRGLERHVNDRLSRFAATQVLGNTLGGFLGGLLARASYQRLYCAEAAVSALAAFAGLFVPTVPVSWMRGRAGGGIAHRATGARTALGTISRQGPRFVGFLALTVASWTAYGLGRDLIQPVMAIHDIDPAVIAAVFTAGGLFTIAGRRVAGHLDAHEHGTGFVLHMIPFAAATMAAGLLGTAGRRPGLVWVLAMTVSLAFGRLVCSFSGHVQEVWLLRRAPAGMKATTLSLAGSATILINSICFYLLGLASMQHGVSMPLFILGVTCLGLHILWQRWLRGDGTGVPEA